MPDPEMYKVILQGGSFGLLAIAVVWLLFWGMPMLEKSLARMGDSHLQAITKLSNDCREERQSQSEQWIAALKDMAIAVERVSERVQGCPHRDPVELKVRGK